MHWSGSCMIRFAAERRLQPSLAGNRVDHAQRNVQVVEHWSLFDVKLHVSEHARPVSRPFDAAGIQTKLTDGLGHRDSPAIRAFQYPPIEGPGDGAAAEKWYAETNPFFFGESQNLNSKLQPF